MIFNLLSDDAKRKIATERNEAVFKSYFISNYKALENYAFYFLKDRCLAEDVSSEVMWKMWHIEGDLLHISNVEQYLLRSVKNKCLNILRVKQLQYVDQDDIKDSILDSNSPENILIETEALLRIQNAIDQLPEKTKQAFLLVKEERLSYKEVAEKMSISTKTVDRHIQIAVKKLLIFLKK